MPKKSYRKKTSSRSRRSYSKPRASTAGKRRTYTKRGGGSNVLRIVVEQPGASAVDALTLSKLDGQMVAPGVVLTGGGR